MKYLIITDHPRNDLRVSKSQKYLDNVTLQIPPLMARFFWVPGYCSVVYLLTFFYRFDRIYAHDLFLSYAVIGRRKPVIADLHENFYDCYNHSRFRFRWLRWFFRTERITKMIKAVEHRSYQLIVSSRLSTEVYHTSLYYDNVQPPTVDLQKIIVPERIVVFIGRNRDLESIDWLLIKQPFTLVVMSNNVPRLNVPLNINVIYTGSNSSYSEVNQYWLQRAMIGLLPHRPSSHIKTCSPNKLFTYMDNGICVLYGSWMSNVHEIVSRYKCGYPVMVMGGCMTIEGGLQWLLYREKEARQIGQNGRAAVMNEYNEQKIIELLFKDLL